MYTQKPLITTVRVKIQEFRGKTYIRSESLTVYATTAAQVTALIQRSIAGNGKKRNV